MDQPMTEVTAPLVTIITPTYNHQEYIRFCIESVLGQSYPHWEQVIIDDGSQDRTPDIIAGYKDPRIRYLRQENLGILRLAKTYNRALDAARGHLIAILEGDDFWPPDKLATLVPAFDDPEVILAYGVTCLATPSGGKIQGSIPPFWFEEPYTRSALFNEPIGSAARLMARPDVTTFTFPCSVILRANALKGIGGFQSDGLPFVDYPTFLRLSVHGKFSFVPKVTGHWRQHLESASWTREVGTTQRAMLRLLSEFMDQNGERIGLTHSERLQFQKSWERSWSGACLLRGRQLLVEKRWHEARRQFKEALIADRTEARLKGLLGCCAAWLHLDLEGLVRTVRGSQYDLRETAGRNVPVGTAATQSEFRARFGLDDPNG